MESKRKEILITIDRLRHRKGISRPNSTFDTSIKAAIRVGDWKLVTGDAG